VTAVSLARREDLWQTSGAKWEMRHRLELFRPSAAGAGIQMALQVIGRAVSSVMRNGPRWAARWALFHLSERLWERRLHVSTARQQRFHSDAYSQLPESIPYEPSPYFLINRVLRAVAKAPQGEVFLDYGSGMGRVVLRAAMLPFKRVIGVELMPELTELANQNREGARALVSPLEFITADATQYIVPDDVTIIHLFNPFTGHVMAEVQARVRESLERAPRALRVIYAHSDDQVNLFAGCSWLRETKQIPTGVMWRMKVVVYETLAASLAARAAA